jgi:uncharacterized membrane protein YcaP (DUF421 family)
MDAILHILVMYGFLLLVFRIAGSRALSQATTFDLLMLLIISETTQQAMVKDDHSMTHAFILILTLVGIDLVLSTWKQQSKKVERILEGLPVILIDDGEVLKDRLDKVRVDESDILEAARELRGLERMDQIKYAVLERSGAITIIPRDLSAAAA